MKTDKDYYYPETPEELSAFYGYRYEVMGIEKTWIDEYNHLTDVQIGNPPRFYRIPKFTLDDLKVGDVVRYEGSVIELFDETQLEYFKRHYIDGYSVELLISRNLWVEVKV